MFFRINEQARIDFRFIRIIIKMAYDWEMYYAYAANATDLKNYNGSCEKLSKESTIKCERNTNLLHIPMQKQCESEYAKLLEESRAETFLTVLI